MVSLSVRKKIWGLFSSSSCFDFVLGGGYAEFVTSPWQLVMVVPDELPMHKAAAVPEVWLTAYMLLHTLGKFEVNMIATIRCVVM